MTMQEAESVPVSERLNAVVCGRCPVFKMNYCGVFAKTVDRMQTACNYGRILIRSAENDKRKKAKR